MQSRRGKEAFVQFRLSAGSGPLDCGIIFWVLDVGETEEMSPFKLERRNIEFTNHQFLGSMLVWGCSGKPESWPLRSHKDLRGIWWMGRPGNAELTWARQQCYEDVDTRNHNLLFANSKKTSFIIHHSHSSFYCHSI